MSIPESPNSPTLSQSASSIFDPANVTYTERLTAYMDEGKPMLNNYARYTRVGGGQHGEVFLCYKIDTRYPVGDLNRRLPVAMKSVKRNNPKAERYKKLLAQGKGLPAHRKDRIPLADKLNTTEQKIRKEIAIMKKLRHPHVVRLYEVIDDRLKDKIYMVMEYLGGGEVKWRNTNNEPVLTVAQTRRILRDAVLGLEYLHYQGIIHRDIKPANLLWTEDRSQVKIGDFGVSHFSYAQRLAAAGERAQDDKHDPLLLDDTDLSKRAGTPSFLAPEVIWEFSPGAQSPVNSQTHLSASPSALTIQSFQNQVRPPVTKSIDIWALGVTLYCLLFGKVPFTTSGSEFELYRVILRSDWGADRTMGSDLIPTGGRQPNRDVPGGAAIHLLDRFLQKDQQNRITLDEVKLLIDDEQSHSWILEDLPDPERWLRATSAAPKINVTADEADDAMSTVRFKWNWGARVTRRISNFFSRPRAGPPHLPGPLPEILERPTTPYSERRAPLPQNYTPRAETSSVYHVASSPGLLPARSEKRDKGKRKEDPRSHRHPGVPPDPILKKRQGSGTLSPPEHTAASSSSQPRSHPDRALILQSLKNWVVRFNQRSVRKPQQVEFAPDATVRHSRISRVDPANRRSEEALRYYRSRQNSDSGLLTAARRASSWGQGDEPLEFAEVMSVTSLELQLNDHDFVVGAGGIEPRAYIPRPRPATSYVPSTPRQGEEEDDGPSNYEEFDAEHIAKYGPPAFDETSTIASVASGYGEGAEPRWTSSLNQDREDDFYVEEEEDHDHDHDHADAVRDEMDTFDEEQEQGVTFSPRKRSANGDESSIHER